MPTIHFVYAGDPNEHSISSPFVITQNVYKFLKQKTESINWDLKYYNWTDGGEINHGPNDIIIGHPNYDENTIIQRTFKANKPCLAKFTIHPLHTRDINANFPFDNLVKQADGMFAICGRYWYDTLEQTKFAHWKSKIIRLDMGIDTNDYPFLKTTINKIGKRNLLYIGSETHYKNLSYMTEIMSILPEIKLYRYGGSSEHQLSRLQNVTTTGNVLLNVEMGRNICNLCDLMINTSISDANPTTLLECASWGIPIACTPGSGYYNGAPFFLLLEIPENDARKAAFYIRNLLNTPEEVLQKTNEKNRKLMETEYNWNIFCNKIWEKLLQYIQ